MFKHIFTIIWNRKGKNALLLAEIFFSFFILFVVMSFVITNMRTLSSPLGFQTEDIWVAYLPDLSDRDSTESADMKDRLRRELLTYSEIESASYSAHVTPFAGSNWATGNDDNGFMMQTYMMMTDENYQETMNVELIAGRWFTEEDLLGKYPPVVINRKLFEEVFGGEPIIDSVYVFEEESKVVGVIDHFKYQGEFAEEPNLTFFYHPSYLPEVDILNLRIKPGTNPEFEETVNKTIASITKSPDFVIRHLDNERVEESRSTWIPMIALVVISSFLIVNIALGLFGVLWYNISKRRAEIGLRRALGASQGNIIQQFMGEILLITSLGMILGLFFAIQFPLLKVFEIPASNFYFAMLSAAGIILAIVGLCTFYPSYQASLTHPSTALHEE